MLQPLKTAACSYRIGASCFARHASMLLSISQHKKILLAAATNRPMSASLCCHPPQLNKVMNVRKLHLSPFQLEPTIEIETGERAENWDTEAAEETLPEYMLQFSDPQFGLLFDCDGVLVRGVNPIPEAIRMMRLLVQKSTKELRLPVAFVTNATGSVNEKAKVLSHMLDVRVHPEQVLHADTPLTMFEEYHKKRVLVVGQGNYVQNATELGFQNLVTIEQLRKAYPQLDMVDHGNRRRLSMGGYQQEGMDRIDAVVLLGEPVAWESYLQVILDVLITDGKPDHKPSAYPERHLPILVANMDLLFMHEACLPRFGHGAFLVCLEALYRSVTGHKLEYTAISGKPSEITMRYAEHIVSSLNVKLGYKKPIRRLYLIGDNPAADIISANLYRRYVQSLRPDVNGNVVETKKLPECRQMPASASFLPQTVTHVEGILVGTGVYNPRSKKSVAHCHESFPSDSELFKPSVFKPTCYHAVQYIFVKEGLLPRPTTEALS